MIHPSYVELMKVVNNDVVIGEEPVVNSRYAIVIATAKRARQLISGAEPMNDKKTCPKALSIAVEEVFESKVKIIDVWTDNSADFNVGDNVMVEIANRIGMMSVLVGFIAPICAVLFGVILTLILTGEGCIFHIDEPYNQAVAAIAGLLMLLPYYIVLYILRNKIRKKITFNILHLNS